MRCCLSREKKQRRQKKRVTADAVSDIPIRIVHPDGFTEYKTAKEISRDYAMTLREYAFFISRATGQEGDEARSRRRNAVAAGQAGPRPVPRVMNEEVRRRYQAVTSAIESYLRNNFVVVRSQRPVEEERSDDRDIRFGGVRATGAKAKERVNSTPIAPELSQEERRKIWSPPERDTSRFSGTSASRHRASASYKDPNDYVTVSPECREASGPWHYGGGGTARDGKAKVGKRPGVRGGGSKGKAKPTASGSRSDLPKASQHRPVPPNGSPLTAKQLRTLDSNYRIHGADPAWKGWSNLIPGRSGRFLLAEAKRLGFDRPDDSVWTKGEVAVLKSNRRKLPPTSPKWRNLLPRKSAVAVAKACGGQWRS